MYEKVTGTYSVQTFIYFWNSVSLIDVSPTLLLNFIKRISKQILDKSNITENQCLCCIVSN